MKKAISIAALLFASLTAAPVFAGYSCEVRTYSHGVNAAKGSKREQLEIIKSWLPENLLVNQDSIQFADREPIEIDSNTSQKIRASVQSKDVEGNKLYTVYEVILKDGGASAWVTMRINRYKPLGPVVYDCVEF